MTSTLFLFVLQVCMHGPFTSAGQIATNSPVRASGGMVVTADEHASRVGVEILKAGGNAVDAAVAVAFALAVTHPTAGNIGGGGFMLVRMADGRIEALDYRETAPAAATRTMYLDDRGEVIPDASLVGHKAAGVPGTVAGLALARERFGTKPWSELIEPARKLAAEGFPVSETLAKDLRATKVLNHFPETRRIFLNDGRYFEAGETLRQPELAATLTRLQGVGPREFYEGQTARLIADDAKANGGHITLDDLKTYKPVVRDALRGTYRGHEIITMPPPSSGGIALLEMLNTLEHFDLAATKPNTVETNHVLIEVMRRAFADRAELLGDPQFTTIPVIGLTSKAYAAHLAMGIDRTRATPSDRIAAGQPSRYESPQTTHFSIVDAAGNAVANTYTLNTDYGCGAVVRGAGFLLNNEMDDFTSKPGSPNAFGLIQSERNAIAPGKRPLSSMTPTIVLKGDRLFLVLGSPGGPRIINAVLQVILNVIDYRMPIDQAVAAPRLHHQWQPDAVRYEPLGLPEEVLKALKALGHGFIAPARTEAIGEVQAILIDPATQTRYGAPDPRHQGRALGY